MPTLDAYKRHVQLYGHEFVMSTAANDAEMSERDVKALAKFIVKTAKKVIHKEDR